MTSVETKVSEELKGCYENLIVVDVGANLTNKKYSRDLDSVIQRAKDSDIRSDIALKIARKRSAHRGKVVLQELETSTDNNDWRMAQLGMLPGIVLRAGLQLLTHSEGHDKFNIIYQKEKKHCGYIFRFHKRVQKIMVTGTSVKNSKEALRLTRLYPGTIYSTAGVHPHDAKSMLEDDMWESFLSTAGAPECVAIGECGLNYSKDFSEPKVQRDVFTRQVEIACDLRKPLFIHEKDAQDDLLKILEGFGTRLPPVVIHSFTGSVEQGLRYLEKGFYMGITGYLCKDKSDGGIRRLLAENLLPLDRLLVETDSPFMYPNMRASKLPPHVKDSLTERSMNFVNRYCTFQRNEPCALPAIVEIIAGFLEKRPEDVALATAFNALKLFGLSQ